jgi:thiamine pyrophosphate-dependent acetolactate synthase large subunit-like protein
VAEGLGAVGMRVDEASRIGDAVAQALASGRPTLIHVPTAEAAPKGGAAD